MKQFAKIFAVILITLAMVFAIVSCTGNDKPGSETSPTTIEETEKEKVTKKPYIAPIIPEVTTEAPTEEPEIPVETGPLPLETDAETGFSGAVDMH